MNDITGLYNASSAHAMQQQQVHNKKNSEAIAQLASGRKDNTVGSSPSNQAIVASLESLNKVIDQVRINAKNASGVLQVAAQSLGNIRGTLSTMSALTAQANSQDIDEGTRFQVNAEYEKLRDQITDFAERCRWNGVSLLSGIRTVDNVQNSANGFDSVITGPSVAEGAYSLSYDQASNEFTLTDPAANTTTATVAAGGAAITFDVTVDEEVSLAFQIGEKSSDVLSTVFTAATGYVLGTDDLKLADTDVLTEANAIAAAEAINDSLATVNQMYSQLGAQQTNLESIQEYLTTTSQELTKAMSNYRDADIPRALTEHTLASIMTELAGIALNKSLMQQQQLVSVARNA